MTVLIVAGRHGATARPLATTSTPAVIQIDQDAGETFTPSRTPPARMRGSVLSEGVVRRILAARDGFPLPSGVTARTGYLTLPRGPGYPKRTYSYAFTWAECGPQILPLPEPGRPTLSAQPLRCTEWLIVDARTGKILDNTWSK